MQSDCQSSLAYAGMYDFVSKHGIAFPLGGDASALPVGTPRACFGNSALIAATYDLRYCEGFASSTFAPDFPVHHAWNLDADGRVVDTTWGPATQINGAAYLGVAFPFETVADAVFHDGTGSVLDDWKRDFLILQQPWEG